MVTNEQIDIFINQLNEKFPKFAFSYTRGKKYYKILQKTHGLYSQTYAYAFVDFNGNILKASGYNAPAKGIRGHISDPFNNCCFEYSIRYNNKQ